MSSAKKSRPSKYIVGAIALVLVFALAAVGRFFYKDDVYRGSELAPLRWPNSQIAQMIPKPDSERGYTYWATSSGFDVDVADYTYEKFDAYVDECMQRGFDVDYYITPRSFSAKNANGYDLYVYFYEDSEVMSISISAPPDEADERLGEDSSDDDGDTIET